MRDYHIHTTYGDGTGTVAQMASAAAALGLDTIAFTEHLSVMHMDRLRQGLLTQKVTILPEEISRFQADIDAAAATTGIAALKGFEVSHVDGYEDETLRVLAEASPEIVLLAVHHLELREDWYRPATGRLEKAGHSFYLAGSAFTEMVRQYGGLENVLEAYVEKVARCLAVGYQDTAPRVGFAHLNVFSRVAEYDAAVAAPYLDRLAGLVAEAGLALEFNVHYATSLTAGEPRPPWRFMETFFAAGGTDVWFGSDAHSVGDLAEAVRWYPRFQEAARR